MNETETPLVTNIEEGAAQKAPKKPAAAKKAAPAKKKAATAKKAAPAKKAAAKKAAKKVPAKKATPAKKVAVKKAPAAKKVPTPATAAPKKAVKPAVKAPAEIDESKLKPHDMHGISRINQANGNRCWFVRLGGVKGLTRKGFADSKHGGEAGALKAAKAYRNEVYQTLPLNLKLRGVTPMKRKA